MKSAAASLKPSAARWRSVFALLMLCIGTQTQAGDVPIWEVDTGSNRFILMGSVHFLRPTDYPLPAVFDSVFDAADSLLMEIDMDDMDPMQSMLVMEQIGKNPEGKTLAELIGASRYREVSSRATTLGIPMMLLDDKEPWYAAMLVSQLRLMQTGFDPSWGIETHFVAKAASAGKSIAGLETLEEQLSTLDSIDIDTQAEFLIQSLNPEEEADAEMATIMAAWKSGNEQALADALTEGMNEMPGLYTSIVVNRNKNWVHHLEQLDSKNQDKTYLVIVGALHLVGKDSLQQQWRGISARQLHD